MLRWNAAIVSSVFLLVLLQGCAQQCFMTEKDFDATLNSVGLSPRLESENTAGLKPLVEDIAAPTTVLDAERPPRYLTLSEAIAYALENGITGIQSSRTPGQVSDDLIGFNNGGQRELRFGLRFLF